MFTPPFSIFEAPFNEVRKLHTDHFFSKYGSLLYMDKLQIHEVQGDEGRWLAVEGWWE
jgi:hypothetical protein